MPIFPAGKILKQVQDDNSFVVFYSFLLFFILFPLRWGRVRVGAGPLVFFCFLPLLGRGLG